MSLYMDAIGVISGVLGIFDFWTSNLPGTNNNGAVLRVKVGHPKFDLNFGGSIAKIQGYDGDNKLIGEAKGAYIPEGGFVDFTLKQDIGGIQTEYATIIGTDDAICISWITLKNLDGALDAAWTGDVGWQCGRSYHWGNQTAGKVKGTSEDYKPKCTWLDADHTNDISTGAMKIYFPGYGQSLQDTINNGATCSKTLFVYNAGEVDGIPSKKRSVNQRSMVGASRPDRMHKRLIISNAREHNARELCEDEMSWGPDVVGSDGYYCNLQTRELLPLCAKEEVNGCVDIDTSSGKVTKRSNVAKRALDLHIRSYEDVQRW